MSRKNVRSYCSLGTIEQEMSRKNVRSYWSLGTVEQEMTRNLTGSISLLIGESGKDWGDWGGQ